MDRSIQYRPLLACDVLRWLGRASACILMVAWAVFVVAELNRSGTPSSNSIVQGVALAVVFAGYLIGWRYELAGGLLSVFATIGYLIVYQVTLGHVPQPEALGFAVPGLLYLAAWRIRHPASRVE